MKKPKKILQCDAFGSGFAFFQKDEGIGRKRKIVEIKNGNEENKKRRNKK